MKKRGIRRAIMKNQNAIETYILVNANIIIILNTIKFSLAYIHAFAIFIDGGKSCVACEAKMILL